MALSESCLCTRGRHNLRGKTEKEDQCGVGKEWFFKKKIII